MVEDLENGLRKLGLDDKQAKVYLATLELGPSPVQKIAQRSGIPRATTYLVLDDLKSKGLVVTYEEGKKSYFVAEKPDRLHELISEQAALVHEQEKLIDQIVPELYSRGRFEKSNKLVVRYYEGPKAVNAFIREGIVSGGGEIINFVNLDKAKETLQKIDSSLEKIGKKREKYRLKSRVIYTAHKGPVKGYATALRQAKYIPEDNFPIAADISVQGDLVILVPYGEKLHGVGIKDPSIAQAIKTIFDLVWNES